MVSGWSKIENASSCLHMEALFIAGIGLVPSVVGSPQTAMLPLVAR